MRISSRDGGRVSDKGRRRWIRGLDEVGEIYGRSAVRLKLLGDAIAQNEAYHYRSQRQTAGCQKRS